MKKIICILMCILPIVALVNPIVFVVDGDDNGGNYKLLILTREIFYDGFKNLSDYHNAHGMSTVIKTLKDVELEMLDPTGVVVQKWILQGTQINDADFGGLDYTSSDLADITLTLRFDRAINVF